MQTSVIHVTANLLHIGLKVSAAHNTPFYVRNMEFKAELIDFIARWGSKLNYYVENWCSQRIRLQLLTHAENLLSAPNAKSNILCLGPHILWSQFVWDADLEKSYKPSCGTSKNVVGIH